MVFGLLTEKKPVVSFGALMDETFTVWRFSLVFVDVIINLPKKSLEQNFGFIVAFKLPLFWGFAFMLEAISPSDYEKRMQAFEQANRSVSENLN